MHLHNRGSDEEPKLEDQAQHPLQADSATTPPPATSGPPDDDIHVETQDFNIPCLPTTHSFESSDTLLPHSSTPLPSTSPHSATSPLLSTSPLPSTSSLPSTSPLPRSPPARKVVLIGNPGVGKSTILNALGGNFPSGFSKVSGLTRTVTSQHVTLDQGRIALELYDVPGIDDCPAENGEDPIVTYLQELQKTLNSGGTFVIIFVIKPSSGRISPSDFLVMKTVIDSLKQAPKVGWILTRAGREDMEEYCTPEYGAMLVEKLGKIVQNKNKKILPSPYPLVLVKHDARIGFSDQDKKDILNYALRLKSDKVQSLNMVEQVVRNFFDHAKSKIF
ncbi:hypothetical protein BGZ95_004549 [Linnemannia exigua]|uniref:G domain-containing protein n=1 Tax=Linnemannia exigua TaxID=604196 RepID=A0AAD4DHA2_9FUNG|nr:hypothetical protein BGZ95_004549 [Linnemannia exigua]